MPSYGRYRRGYKSNNRRYRRYKRTFSKYNTYRNRSSVSQANQIYKLNKRISKIESNTKPEYLEFMPPTAGSPIAALSLITRWSALTSLHITDLGYSSDTAVFGKIMKGTSARVFKIIVWGALERNPAILPENVDKHDSAMSCGYVRLAVLQYAAEKYADVSPIDIFDIDSGPSGFYHPLKRGCGSFGRILKIFNIKISSQDPTTKPFKFIIKPKYKIVRRSLDDSTNQPIANQRMKGGIVVLPIGYVESNNITHPDTFHFSMSAKAIYTDA